MLQEAKRVGEMLEDVPGNDKIRPELGQMADRLEELGAQGDGSGAGRRAMRVEAEIGAVGSGGGEPGDEAAIAMADLDDDGTFGQPRQQALAQTGEEP